MLANADIIFLRPSKKYIPVFHCLKVIMRLVYKFIG